MAASLEDRLAVASSLILQSPPGEVNDVFNDLRPIVGDDDEIERGLLPALTQYNTEQFALVDLPNAKIPAMICPAARLDDPSSGGEDRFLDPHSQQTFIFDHLRLTASDLRPFTPADQQVESLRSELSQEAERYVKNHFHSAVWSVFSTSSSNKSKNNNSGKQKRIEVKPTDETDAQPGITQPNETAEETPTEVEQPGGSTDHPDPDPANVTVEDEPENKSVSKPSSTSDQIDQGQPADHDPNHHSSSLPTSTNQPAKSPTESSSSSSSPPSNPSSRKFELYIVGNKYNPTNYWTGRWRSIYEIDLDSSQIRGQIHVNVHYYEQGNVQLTTNHSPTIELNDPEGGGGEGRPATASRIIKAIEQVESKYQTNLNTAYTDLGDNTFKQLRRALPLTKQKVNWTNMKTRIVIDEK